MDLIGTMTDLLSSLKEKKKKKTSQKKKFINYLAHSNV